MPVIQCPGCEKKLKLKALRPGAKIKCPGCAKVFQAQAADTGPAQTATEKPVAKKASPSSGTQEKSKPPGRTPAKATSAAKAKPVKKRPAKKRPAPVDDFGDNDFLDDDFGGGDEFGGDDYGDDFGQPAARPSGNRKAAKKKPTKEKSKKPLIIGLAVLAVAAIGGGAFYILNDGSSSDGEVAATDDSNPTGSEGDEHGNDGDDGHGGDDAGHGNDSRNAALASGGAASESGGFSTDSSPVDLQWLPSSTEGIVHIKVSQLMTGPLGAFVQTPNIAAQVQQFEAMAGFGLENIDSLTVGVSRISELSQQQKEPDPESMALIAVIRANKQLDPSRLTMVAPNATQVTEGSVSYYRIPQDPPVAVWMPNDQTVVAGAESVVQQVASATGGTSSLDSGLLNGQASIEIAFSPAIPDAIFRHPNFRIPENSPTPVPPPVRTLVGAIKKHVIGASIGITLTQDLGFRTAFRCRDEAGAKQFGETFKQVSDELQKLQDPSAGGQGIPPGMAMMMAPFQQISDAMNKSFTVTSNGTLTSSSAEAKGGGQTLASFVPLAASMIGPAIASGRTAAQRVESKNNLKQLGLAMLNFHDAYRRFPNAVGKGPNGEEWLSWRVHLLPFLGYKPLYDQFALEEPWDSPTNRPLVDQMPDVFRSPKVQTAPGKTVYLVPVSPGTMFDGQKGRAMRTVTDGTSNTIMMVEVEEDQAVYWTQPSDFQVPPSGVLAGLAKNNGDNVTVLMVDGSTRELSVSTDEQAVKHLFEVADGNPVNLP